MWPLLLLWQELVTSNLFLCYRQASKCSGGVEAPPSQAPLRRTMMEHALYSALLSYSLKFDGTWSSRTPGSTLWEGGGEFYPGFEHGVPEPRFELSGGRGRARPRGSSIEFPKPRVRTSSSRTQGSNSLGAGGGRSSRTRGSNMEFSKPRVRT